MAHPIIFIQIVKKSLQKTQADNLISPEILWEYHRDVLKT